MASEEILLLSTAYFPPVQYFHFLASGKKVKIEVRENYIKQTYRNRCNIYSPNGIQALTVPVERGSFHKVAIDKLKIDYSRPWQENHLRALKTAYNSSAFYEFLIDDIEKCIMGNFELLIDLNRELLGLIIEIIDMDIDISYTKTYITNTENYYDLRARISPKSEDPQIAVNLPEYFQVFGHKSGFIQNLSVLDLVFNMGPESYRYL